MAELKNTVINDTGAIGLPGGTTAQRPGSPQSNYTRYNTSANAVEYYDGTKFLWLPVDKTKIGSVQEYPAPSARWLQENLGTSTSGFYWIKTPNMTTATTVYCDMETGGGGYMLCWIETGGPLEFSNSTFYGTLNGSASSDLSPFRHNQTYDWGVTEVWRQEKDTNGFTIMKQYAAYNNEDRRVDYTYQDGSTNGLLHNVSAQDRVVHDKLFTGAGVSMLDIYGTDFQSGSVNLANTVNLFVDQNGSGATFDYGSTARLIDLSSANRGFANDGANDMGVSPQMRSWGARHWIAYSGASTNYSRVRCQYVCWGGTEGVLLEVGIYVREETTFDF